MGSIIPLHPVLELRQPLDTAQQQRRLGEVTKVIDGQDEKET